MARLREEVRLIARIAAVVVGVFIGYWLGGELASRAEADSLTYVPLAGEDVTATRGAIRQTRQPANGASDDTSIVRDASDRDDPGATSDEELAPWNELRRGAFVRNGEGSHSLATRSVWSNARAGTRVLVNVVKQDDQDATFLESRRRAMSQDLARRTAWLDLARKASEQPAPWDQVAFHFVSDLRGELAILGRDHHVDASPEASAVYYALRAGVSQDAAQASRVAEELRRFETQHRQRLSRLIAFARSSRRDVAPQSPIAYRAIDGEIHLFDEAAHPEVFGVIHDSERVQAEFVDRLRRELP